MMATTSMTLRVRRHGIARDLLVVTADEYPGYVLARADARSDNVWRTHAAAILGITVPMCDIRAAIADFRRRAA